MQNIRSIAWKTHQQENNQTEAKTGSGAEVGGEQKNEEHRKVHQTQMRLKKI